MQGIVQKPNNKRKIVPPKRRERRDFRYFEKSQYYLASQTGTNAAQSWKKHFCGAGTGRFFTVSPGLTVPHHPCTSNHIIKGNLTTNKDQVPLLGT